MSNSEQRDSWLNSSHRTLDADIEEVLRRIEKNDLDVKPKKYIWKVREIDFLGLVMELGGIKIQEEVEVLE